jgi:hypothetical protein
MKHFAILASSLGLAFVALADEPATGKTKNPAAIVYDDQSAFDYIKTLAGNWERMGAAGLQQGRWTLLARRGTTAHSRPRAPLVSPEAATGRYPHCAQRPDSRRRCTAYQALDACSLA